MPNIILKNENGDDELYEDIDTVRFLDDTGGIVSYKYNSGEDFSRPNSEQHSVRFLDYDGFVLHEIFVDSGDTVHYPSENPVRAGFVFDGWTRSAEALSSVTQDMDVYALYYPENSDTTVLEFYRLASDSTNLQIHYWSDKSNEFFVDWGDGSSSTVNPSSSTSRQSFSHTYDTSFTGHFTITITRVAGDEPYNLGYNKIGSTSQTNTSAFGNSYTWAKNRLLSITLARGIPGICYCSFRECRALKYVSLSKDAYIIDDHAFYSCASLETISLPSSIRSIGSYAFSSCTCLKCVAIPENTELIHGSAFRNCRVLESIAMPISALHANGYTLYECNALQRVGLYGSGTNLPQYFMYNNYRVRKVVIPDGVTTLDTYALYGVYNISVTLPSSVQTLADNSLYTNSTADLYFLSSEPPTITASSIRTSKDYHTTIHVPAGSLNTYKSEWSNLVPFIVGDL